MVLEGYVMLNKSMVRHILKYFVVVIALLCCQTAYPGNFDREPGFAYPLITEKYSPRSYKPRQYVVYRTVHPIIVDGVMDERSWYNAAWTRQFGHIFMVGYQRPFLATRAKMLWDSSCLYAAVELEETNLIGHVVENDTEIYDDNDIEMFIDTSGDSQNYIELEFNCLGTVWDMFLYKEYNRGGIPFSHPKVEGSQPWDLEGMKIATRVDGSLNYPFDTDSRWVIEIALPWESLNETAGGNKPLDRNGASFRVNFSRVQHPWPDDIWPIEDWNNRGGPCWDWTWSQNLVYNMHSCESWGRIIMSTRTVLQATDTELENSFSFVEPPQPKRRLRAGEMVRIKGGKYSIGPDETDSASSPAGEIVLNDFYIDSYEVTIGEYTAFLNDVNNVNFYSVDMANPDFCGIVCNPDSSYSVVPGKDMYPIVFVTAEAAKAYASWCGKRLPTEFECEAAARGKDGRTYPWGEDTPNASRANYDYMVGHPTPVGSYDAGRSPEGVYDLAGNAWEIVEGNWAAYPWSGITTKPRTSAPLIRGGSWVTPSPNISATYRNAMKGTRAPMYGFRCARNAR